LRGSGLNVLPQALHLSVFSMLGPSGCLKGPGACKRGRRTRRKKEEELSGKEPEENPAEEEGISNRPIYPIFIPPLTNEDARGKTRQDSQNWLQAQAEIQARYTQKNGFIREVCT